jgi:hypothetical protein
MQQSIDYADAKFVSVTAIVCCDLTGSWRLWPGFQSHPAEREHLSSGWSQRARDAKVRRLADDNK